MNSSFSKFRYQFSCSNQFRLVTIVVASLTFLIAILIQTDRHAVRADSSAENETVAYTPDRFAVNTRFGKGFDSRVEMNTVSEIGQSIYRRHFNLFGLQDSKNAPQSTPILDTGAIRSDYRGEGISYPQVLPEDWDADGVTIMAWVYVANSQDSDAALMAIRGAGILYLDGGSGQTIKIYTGSSQSWTNNTRIPLQSWHHFALVRVGGTRIWRAYLDGVLDFSGVNLVEPTDNPHLYFSNNTYGDWLDGRIAAGKIWRSTLSQAEIQAEMGSYAPVRTANIWSVVPMRVHTDLTDQSGLGNTPTAMGILSTEDGPPLETSVSLSGRVAYLDSAMPARNVDLILTSPFPKNQTTTSDINGEYAFPMVTTGYNYAITPLKSGDVNGISSFDANLVLRYVAAGGGTFSPNQQIAADTNDNGSVTSFDATQILRFTDAGGPTSGTGQAGTWKFNPPIHRYFPLLSSIRDENYAALLIGEVSGNWSPTATPFETNNKEAETAWPIATQFRHPQAVKVSEGISQKAVLTGVQLSLPMNANAGSGATVTIPVRLTNNNSKVISGYAFAVIFDPMVLQPAIPEANSSGTLSNSFNLVADTHIAGRLGIAAAGGNNVSMGDGTLVYLRFTVIGQPQATSILTFSNFLFEDDLGDTIPCSPTGGTFFVTGPTAASVNVRGRILSADGRPIRNSIVTMTDLTGETRTSRSGPLGYYQFFEVEAGQTYSFSVRSRQHSFATSTIIRTINDDIWDIDFIADK